MDTKPTVKSLVIRGAFMMTPVKELHFKDGTTDKLNCAWDDLPPYVQENWAKLGNMLGTATGSELWKADTQRQCVKELLEEGTREDLEQLMKECQSRMNLHAEPNKPIKIHNSTMYGKIAISDDWTVGDDNRSNTSTTFRTIQEAIASLIRSSAHDLISGRVESVAGLITAQLAHVHGLRPGPLPQDDNLCSSCHCTRGSNKENCPECCMHERLFHGIQVWVSKCPICNIVWPVLSKDDPIFLPHPKSIRGPICDGSERKAPEPIVRSEDACEHFPSVGHGTASAQCICTIHEGARYAHVKCTAFHTIKAIGLAYPDGQLMKGDGYPPDLIPYEKTVDELGKILQSDIEPDFCSECKVNKRPGKPLAHEPWCSRNEPEHNKDPLTDGRECPFENKLCPECNQELKPNPSGWSCANGHAF